MENYIYAFDLSMACTGIVIFDKEVNPVFIGNIQTKDKDSHGIRLKQIADFILELRTKFPTNKIVLERGFSRFNISTQVIYRVHGLVNYLFSDCEQIYYPPKQIKAAILDGKASKKEIQDAIKVKYPTVQFNCIKLKKSKGKEESKDESDAFATGLTYFILEKKMDLQFTKVSKSKKKTKPKGKKE